MARKSEQDRVSVNVGRIGAPYGIKGWVRINSFTEPKENLFGYSPWQLASLAGGKLSETVQIIEHRKHGKGWVVRLEGVADRTSAEALRGMDISVPRASLPQLEGDSYYWTDLEGLQVLDSQGQPLGRIDHMLATGAADVMVVICDVGQASGLEQRQLVPFLVGETVLKVDLDAGLVTIDWEFD